jgi:hypothetical protein
VPVIVQVLNNAAEIEAAKQMLAEAFGQDWPRHADLSYIEPLSYGRGETVFARPPAQPADGIGACSLLAAPVVRYDGKVTACCNEPLIMGRGPDRLRRTVLTEGELAAALDAFRNDALLAAIGTVGAGALTAHPAYAQLASEQVRGICDLCWRLQDATAAPLGDRGDPVLALLPLLVRPKTEEGAA